MLPWQRWIENVVTRETDRFMTMATREPWPRYLLYYRKIGGNGEWGDVRVFAESDDPRDEWQLYSAARVPHHLDRLGVRTWISEAVRQLPILGIGEPPEVA